MEDIKTEIRKVLNLTEVEVLSVAEHLCEEVGVEGQDDLILVEPDDLPMLKKIQIRKLIQAWKKTPGWYIYQNSQSLISPLPLPSFHSQLYSTFHCFPFLSLYIFTFMLPFFPLFNLT